MTETVTSSTSVSSVPASLTQHEPEGIRDDFGLFVYYLWRELRLPVPTPVQIDIARWLHHGPRRRMVKAFRGVGKSWLTAAYVLWLLKRNVNERILVVSASADRAQGFVIFVRRLIEEVSWLRHLKPGSGQKDTTEAFEVGGAEPHQSPSVKSASITGQITGSRATTIVADDIEIPRNALTVKLRERLANDVKEFDAILLPEGQIVYLGTDQTEMSLYRQLPGRGYEVRVWPARVPTAKKQKAYGESLAPLIREMIDAGTAPDTPTDPDRFDNEDLLEREASYGRSGFAMQFMLDPVMGDAERYPLRCRDFIVMDINPDAVPTQVVYGSDPKYQVIQDLECIGLSGDCWMRPMGTSQEFVPTTPTAMFVDPSGRGRDETAVAVGGAFGPMVFVYAVDGWVSGYADETLDGIVELAKTYKVGRVLVEPNFGGGMYANLLRSAFAKAQYPVTVEDTKSASGQKELRIIDTLEPALTQHRVVLNRSIVTQDLKTAARRTEQFGAEGDGGAVYQLPYQLTRLTRERGALKHDDRVEALAGLVAHFTAQQRQTSEDAHARHLGRLRDAEVAKFLREFEGTEPPSLWNDLR